jgi:uncharacterized protein YkwD
MSDQLRVRYTLVAASVLVVIGGGFAVAGFRGGTDPASARPAAEQVQVDDQAPAADPATDPASAALSASAAAPTATPRATPPTSAPAKPRVTKKPAQRPTTRPTTTRPTTEPTGKPTKPAASDDSVIQQVLSHINAARADEGLPAYTLNSGLSKAAGLHTALMIDGCGMSHRCPGEADLGDRFTAQGVSWSSAGENVGYGSAGGSTSAIVGAANGLTDSMLAEVPPEDGHRRNLLSKSFKRIGLSVVRDGKGLVWMTQDFTS